MDHIIKPIFNVSQPEKAPTVRNIRSMFQSITTDTENQRTHTVMFIDKMDMLSGDRVLKAALTPEEISRLRYIIFASCLEDVLADIGLDGDHSNRFLLVRYYHAIQLLGVPKDDEFGELYFYGYLCAALDKHREARDVFQKALALQPDNATLQGALACVSDCMSLPRFRLSCVTRCRKAWESIATLLRDPGVIAATFAPIDQLIRKIFRIWTGTDIQIVPHSSAHGVIGFCLSHNWQLSQFPIEAAIKAQQEALPKSICNKWDISTVLFRMSEENFTRNAALNLGSAQTVLEDTPEHRGVHVKLYHRSLARRAASPEALDALCCEILQKLSPADYQILIRSVEVLSQRPARSTGTIDDLDQQLIGMGYTLDHTEEEVEALAMRRTYTRQPQEASPRLRDDILQGDSILLCLQEEYERQETATADYFMDRGIAPVFLAWPRSIMDCSEEEFTQKLLEKLGTGTVSLNLRVLGKASGTEYCYLDLLLWNTFIVVDTIEAYFAKIPGGDALRIQSFYYDAYPCPVSRSYILEHSSIPVGEGTSASGAYRRVPGAKSSTSQKPKNKKKNAAKAKRKHSKKFH